MSLFDELLTKSQPASTSSSSVGYGQQQGPLVGEPIIINESSPISTTVTDGVLMVPIESVPSISPDPIKKTPVSDDALVMADQPEVFFGSQEMGTSAKKNDEAIEQPQNNSLFSMIDLPQAEVSVSKKTTEVSFRDTNEYIEHAIEEVSDLISSLDAADQAKLVEESEYENQKEHFAELEVQAESEHQKILSEKSHAEEMKKYLENERAVKENSVEIPQEEQAEEIASPENQQEEEKEQEDISPKKKEWNGFSKKNNKSEEKSREIFL